MLQKIVRDDVVCGERVSELIGGALLLDLTISERNAESLVEHGVERFLRRRASVYFRHFLNPTCPLIVFLSEDCVVSRLHR